MHAIRQTCRPKHQVLVLNCYPRTVKGAVDVKPNSSELSYLLYYATTRRSKAQKVGAFLEKKTASDVWRARIGNVQVTLQIVAALIEKAPRDLPLYASHVLKLLSIILHAHDITMVESSLPTFESFCQHHDEASLSANQEYLCQYEEIVRIYASFASTNIKTANQIVSTPITLKWRNVGLQAIKSFVSSEALSSVAGRQLDSIVPTLLENIWSKNPDYINLLEHKAQAVERLRTKSFSRRRTSIATVQSPENMPEINMSVLGTTADADKVAETDNGALAVECLKLVFAVNNKAQIHGATLVTLKFIGERFNENEAGISSEDRAVHIFQMISSWTPVQDRYTILVTVVDILADSSMNKDKIQQQLLLATLIDSLLKSDINLIGLSVMDVLLSLIQNLLRALETIRVSSQEINPVIEGQWPLNSNTETFTGSPSTIFLRKKLLEKLQDCISHLATHVYYADQISDMVVAILWRLKPWPKVVNQNMAPVTEESAVPASATNLVSDQYDDTNAEGFFLYAAAKIRALEAIKSILITAGLREGLLGVGNLARNIVSARVWEGTQWLLRDNDIEVRKAYTAALLTWMEYEMTKNDHRACEDKSNLQTRNFREDSASSSNKREVSSISQKEKKNLKQSNRTLFLEQLHLAIYDNAVRYSESEEDIIMLHLLLASLVEKLGVNAVKNGLPMIFRLQEDISEVPTSLGKVHIASLCHGYFWILSEKFNLHSTPVDIEIHREINRRQKAMVWIDKIRVPPIRLEKIRTLDQEVPSKIISLKNFNADALRPFTKRSQMIELISTSYVETLMTQAANAPNSPSRSSSQPTADTSVLSTEFYLPAAIKSQMMSQWTRDSIIVAVQESSRTVSLAGSKNGTIGTKHRNFLTASVNERTQSPAGYSQSHLGHKDRNRLGLNHGPVSGIGPLKKLRRASDNFPSGLGEINPNSITRVEYLKRVLSGHEFKNSRRITSSITPSDVSSESVASYTYSTSDISFNQSQLNLSQSENYISDHDSIRTSPKKICDDEVLHAAPSSSNPMTSEENPNLASGPNEVEVVPPLPSIPRLYKDEANLPSNLILSEDSKISNIKTASKLQIHTDSKESSKNLEKFLNNIQVESDRSSKCFVKPPY
ncbi:Protein EFR3 [Golovinomyces cichoracearum]|uniref:Protein EFR3 n=1 Tax=Golovinomyces cichoracearum TaxID=62708 RepID=A0A420J2Y6_9PEZI|nr:Protein EFR3 [Golovinomyces cichoracearum]